MLDRTLERRYNKSQMKLENERIKNMETNEKRALLGEIQRATELYVMMSVCTKMPYVYCEPETFDDQIFLFHKEEDAKKLVQDFKAKEIPILPMKLVNKQFLSFYTSLYTMGVNGISVDFGTENAWSFQLSELVRRPDASKLPEGQVLVENPELQLTALYYMQEIRRKPGIGQEPRFREMEEEMTAHFRKGSYIVPVKDKNSVPFMKLQNEDVYQPIFTDMPEFLKFNREGTFRAAVLPCAKLPEIVLPQSKGLIVNPMGVRLLLNKSQIK